MTLRHAQLALLVLLVAVAHGCASLRAMDGPDPPGLTRDARIITYKDAKGVCHTNTTPYVRGVKKNKDHIRWRIVDDYDCTEPEDVKVRIVFDKGDPNPFVAGCVLEDDKKIQCELRPDAQGGVLDYSVWIGTEQEDPELEIEM